MELFMQRIGVAEEDWPLLRRILEYGGPTALQQMLQPIGKVLIQGQVNALGVDTIAAYNAVTKADDFACIPVAYYNDFWLQSAKIDGMWHSPYGYWYFMYADIAE